MVSEANFNPDYISAIRDAIRGTIDNNPGGDRVTVAFSIPGDVDVILAALDALNERNSKEVQSALNTTGANSMPQLVNGFINTVSNMLQKITAIEIVLNHTAAKLAVSNIKLDAINKRIQMARENHLETIRVSKLEADLNGSN